MDLLAEGTAAIKKAFAPSFLNGGLYRKRIGAGAIAIYSRGEGERAQLTALAVYLPDVGAWEVRRYLAAVPIGSWRTTSPAEMVGHIMRHALAPSGCGGIRRPRDMMLELAAQEGREMDELGEDRYRFLVQVDRRQLTSVATVEYDPLAGVWRVESLSWRLPVQLNTSTHADAEGAAMTVARALAEWERAILNGYPHNAEWAEGRR